MLFWPTQRATLLMPSGPATDPERMHLHILLTDAATQDQLVLTVSILSVKPDIWHDRSCLLQRGDHAFIRHDIWVDYRRLALRPAASFLAGIRAGLFVGRGMLAVRVFARVCRGLEQSDHVAPKFLNFFRRHGGQTG